MVFNKPDPAPFRATLQQAGLLQQVAAERSAPECWGLLEKYTGAAGVNAGTIQDGR